MYCHGQCNQSDAHAAYLFVIQMQAVHEGEVGFYMTLSIYIGQIAKCMHAYLL